MFLCSPSFIVCVELLRRKFIQSWKTLLYICIARYVEGTRPRVNGNKKRKIAKKHSRLDKNFFGSPEPVTFQNVSSNVEGKYQSYATLQDMYDNYKVLNV